MSVHHLNPSKRSELSKIIWLKSVSSIAFQRKAETDWEEATRYAGAASSVQGDRCKQRRWSGYDEFETAVGPKHLDIDFDEEVHQLCIACDIDGNGDITFEESCKH